MAITKINTPELLDINTTGAKQLPSGPTTGTGGRPTTGLTAGDFRYNTTDDRVEYYDGAAWFQIDDEALPVACTTDTINYPSGTTNTAYYKMSDATDSTLNAYNGTATSVDFNVQGKFGNAGSFNGSSSAIALPDNSFEFNNFSLSAWVNQATTGGNQTVFNTFQATSGATGYFFYLNTGRLALYIYGSTAIQVLVDVGDAITANSWFHVAATCDSTNNVTKLYVNGVEKKTGTAPAITWPGGGLTDPSIGANRWGNTNQNYWFNGKIDQVRVYNSILDLADVTSLYNEVQCVPAIIPSDYFNPVIYDGTGVTNLVTGVGFAADFIWFKGRDYVDNHFLIDSVRGINKFLLSNSTAAETTTTGGSIDSINNDGYTLQSTPPFYGINFPAKEQVSWNWKAAGFANDFNVLEGGTVTTSSSAATAGITAGTITTGWNVSANRDAGFSIVSYTGTGNYASVGHGLNSAPELIIIKLDGIMNWVVYNSESGASKFLTLNSTAYAETYDMWQNTSPTNSVFTISTDAQPNTINGNYIAYCFYSVDGYSDIGSYIGTGAAGNTIVTGFRPAFVMIKRATNSSTGGDWVMYDNKRDTSNPNTAVLAANLDSDESAFSSGYDIDFLSNGFELQTSGYAINNSGETYIYLAIAEQVYNANGVTANQTNPFNDGSQVAQYEFEDNATDSQPNGYIGKGGTFNGSSSYITTPYIISGNPQSFSFWIKAASGGTRRVICGDFSLSTGTNGRILIELNGSNQIMIYIGNSSGTLWAGWTPQSFTSYLNSWTNLIVTVSGTEVKLYLNGTLISTQTSGQTMAAGANGLMIGGYGQTLLLWNGSIDQVRIYNTVLNPNDVWLLYSETSATSSTLDYPASTGAQALYELEGDATSTSSSTYDGAATAVAWVPLYDGTENSMTYSAPSVSAPFLKAAVFNGTSSRITSGLTSGLIGSYSVSAWFTQDNISTDTAHRELISYMDVDGSTGWWIGKHNNTSDWRILGVTGVSIVTMTAQAGWNHIAVVKDSSTVYVYLNGSEVTSFTFPGYWPLGSGNTPQFNIGTQYTGTTEFWDGSIDQVRIFNKALDSGEVTQLYNEPNN